MNCKDGLVARHLKDEHGVQSSRNPSGRKTWKLCFVNRTIVETCALHTVEEEQVPAIVHKEQVKILFVAHGPHGTLVSPGSDFGEHWFIPLGISRVSLAVPSVSTAMERAFDRPATPRPELRWFLD